MTEIRSLVADPVCGTKVPATQYQTIHLGIHYAFCSEHCRNRFVSKIGLYTAQHRRQAGQQDGLAPEAVTWRRY